ncbi:MAG: putative selenate reductase subunit YgfK [Acidobacteriota bacterium]
MIAVSPGSGSDKFYPLPVNELYNWIKNERKTGYIFGIPEELFFRPSTGDRFRTKRFGQLLETPVGLAAGPHTQLAPNIIAGWLTGARYIELKTIQDLDMIEVTKPCIDMRDEGYNCEWSQELNIEQSFLEYLKAWILLHLLKHELGIGSSDEEGFIFNMSAGYDLAGIKGEKVTGFLENMRNSSEHKNGLIDELSRSFPDIRDIHVPDMISDNITVSTMHGTPPEEIEKIGRYFIEEAGLHTTIKLNPTLLGREKVREIINRDLGYDIVIPDSAFEHDIKYSDALDLVKNLKETAEKHNTFFGIKLTNTLESINSGEIFPGEEKMAYMSGRALHPVSVNIASMFRKDLPDGVDISFSAGADAFNIPDLISCGLMPVTISSDILKPGGYGRIRQYITKLDEAISGSGSESIDEYIRSSSREAKNTTAGAALKNIRSYAAETIRSGKYRREGFKKKDTKTERKLDLFDCIKAPCTDSCGTSQDVPGYLYLTSEKKFGDAFKTIIKTNSFPNTTGMVCDHQCQIKCTRSNYDNPLKIREVKRFLAENYGEKPGKKMPASQKGTGTIAIIGAGPSGLSCARYLSETGFTVNIYEKEEVPGGMIGMVIPDFRLGSRALEKDIERISDPETIIRYKNNIGPEEFAKIRSENKYVYISTGAQESIRLEIEGIDSPGVLDPLQFLSKIKSGSEADIGEKIAVIGGGNTAIDSARTALRIAGENAEVTILYRRTKKEMPADSAEVISAIEEGVKLIELITPERVVTDSNGNVSGLRCIRTRLGDMDMKGKRYPVKIDGSETDLVFDTIIPAVGQKTAPDLFDKNVLNLKKEGRLFRDKNILVGGDAGPGSSTIVNAVGDGKAAAEIIISESGLMPEKTGPDYKKEISSRELRLKKAQRQFGQPLKELPPVQRLKAGPVISVMTESEAVEEAERCLLCDELCDICVTVCPNRANIAYNCEPVSIDIPVYVKRGNLVKIAGEEKFEILQADQIMNITDLCNHCGNCTTFCPSSGKPFRDKPRLALSAQSFKNENNAFHIFLDRKEKKIIYKRDSKLSYLYIKDRRIFFTSEDLSLSFSIKKNKIVDINIESNSQEIPDFRTCLTMKFILDNFPGLPNISISQGLSL